MIPISYIYKLAHPDSKQLGIFLRREKKSFIWKGGLMSEQAENFESDCDLSFSWRKKERGVDLKTLIQRRADGYLLKLP
jgi:hypothetical protein